MHVLVKRDERLHMNRSVPTKTPVNVLSGRSLVFLLFVALNLAYLPDIGHGFIKDDFAWILHGRLDGVQDAVALFGRSLGFYRPLVALSFGGNTALFGELATRMHELEAADWSPLMPGLSYSRVTLEAAPVEQKAGAAAE